jgi:hypothetical protein
MEITYLSVMNTAHENIQARPKFVSSIHIDPSVPHLAKHMLQHVFKHPIPFSNKHKFFSVAMQST